MLSIGSIWTATFSACAIAPSAAGVTSTLIQPRTQRVDGRAGFGDGFAGFGEFHETPQAAQSGSDLIELLIECGRLTPQHRLRRRDAQHIFGTYQRARHIAVAQP